MESRALSRSVTMEDVAREAGVSRALVSLVMRESPKVSPAKRSLVLDVASRLGYSRNRLASQLASRRSHTIGVLLLDLRNTVFADIYDGIAEGMSESGNHLMVAVGSADPLDEEAAIRSFVDLRVDGILLAGYTGSAERLATAAQGTPAVVITREIHAPGIDSVLADDLQGGELAVDFLHSLGHRRIAHIANRSALPYGSRRSGYFSAMLRHGLEPLVVEEDMTESGGYRAMEAIMAASPKPPTAVFANNDMAGSGALAALARAGLRVPEDVSVLGFDNTDLAASDLIQLSSVDQHSRELGKLGADQLLRRIAGDSGASTVRKLQPQLVPRRSTTAPKNETRPGED
ncbi:LacI family DNA-binding transcriptional regulator [Paenarthrobacter sp. NPDC089714]|uniref:LacI family DNA-binding transcriptional regulator n=1 Tax=Paenarthrobacter sp. NPDC089714 TaxID=3364377 RepID=UPI00381DCAB3